MDVKIINYIDSEKQLAQKQALEDAKKQEQIDQFKNLLSNAVEEIKEHIDKKEIQTGNQTNNQTSNQLTKATSASEELGCPAEYDAYFEEAAKTYNVDINLLKSIAKAESSFQSDVVSSAGAIGVMQLMPGTAEALGVTNPYDPYQNIMGGAKYISDQLKEFDGDIKLALAAYNAGPNAVKSYGGIPPYDETQNYVIKISGYLERANNAETNKTSTNSPSITKTSNSDASNTQSVTRAQLYTSIEHALDLIQQSLEQMQEEENE